MLKQRILTALVLLPVALWGFFALAGPAFAVFTGAVIILGAWEWARLAGYETQSIRVCYSAVMGFLLLALYGHPELAGLTLGLGLVWWLLAIFLVKDYPRTGIYWKNPRVALLLGVPLLLPAWQGLQVLKSLPQGNALILMVMVLIWAADIGAYFSGRRFGKHKLAPEVSPGKTWEGVAGGFLASFLITLGIGFFNTWGLVEWLWAIPGVVLVVGFSILGDLTESMFKRSIGIKDSSQLLPGHGGVLDRIDSLTAAIPVFTLLLCLAGWVMQ